MKIKQAAELTGVPASTIRYHEQQGLLSKATRSVNGYRDYKTQDIEKIKLIKFCQSLGFNIKELNVLLDEEQPKNHEKILANLALKEAEMESILQQMAAKLAKLSQLRSVLSKSWNAGECLTQQQIKHLIEDNTI